MTVESAGRQVRRRMIVQYHESELGRWSEAMLAPHPALGGLVAMSFLGAGEVYYRRDRILPRGLSFLLINLGPPVYLVDPHGGLPREFRETWFCGQQETYLETEAPHGQALLGVAFEPRGAYSLLRIDQDELAGEAVELEVLLGDRARRLRERLLELRGFEERLALVERWLFALAGRGRSGHPVVPWAVERIAGARGRLRIDELAADSGYSRKHLWTLFRREVGLTPKGFARVHRFLHAVETLRRADGVPWSHLAVDCGYYDQSHLIRDVQAFAGCTPGDLLAAGSPDAGTLVFE